MMNNKMNIENIKKEIPYRWKVQSFNKPKTKASCVAYIDARDVMDLLDETLGCENWRDEFRFENNQWLCGLSFYLNDKWITKWDTGTAGDIEAAKSAISDSFKRAAVKWGVGRFLYDLDIKWIDIKKTDYGTHPIDKQGNRIYNLTEHFNKNINNNSNNTQQMVYARLSEAANHGLETFREVWKTLPKENTKNISKEHLDDLRTLATLNSKEIPQ